MDRTNTTESVVFPFTPFYNSPAIICMEVIHFQLGNSRWLLNNVLYSVNACCRCQWRVAVGKTIVHTIHRNCVMRIGPKTCIYVRHRRLLTPCPIRPCWVSRHTSSTVPFVQSDRNCFTRFPKPLWEYRAIYSIIFFWNGLSRNSRRKYANLNVTHYDAAINRWIINKLNVHEMLS